MAQNNQQRGNNRQRGNKGGGQSPLVSFKQAMKTAEEWEKVIKDNAPKPKATNQWQTLALVVSGVIILSLFTVIGYLVG